jgi:hypothetical protein
VVPAVAQVVLHALAKPPEARFSSAAELADALGTAAKTSSEAESAIDVRGEITRFVRAAADTLTLPFPVTLRHA